MYAGVLRTLKKFG